MRNASRVLGLCSLVLVLSNTVPSAFGQDTGSIINALLRLRTLDSANKQSTINGRLYGGVINATITHAGSVNEVTDRDAISLLVTDPRGRIGSVDCVKTVDMSKSEFDGCVQQNVNQLVRILFPASLSSSLTGRDAAQNHSEMFLLTTALETGPSQKEARRSNIGGLVEHEWFSNEETSGHAWQGLYQLESLPISFQGRYARQHDAVNTGSATVSVDYHPSFPLNPAVNWRVGFDGRSGILYSRSSPLNGGTGFTPLQLASLDYGGGIWTSVRKDVSRFRLGGATLFQASNSHVPSFGGDDFDFVVQAINKRPFAYDVTYGGLVGFLSSDRTSLNGKFIETRSVASDINWPRPPARLGMVSFSYLLDGVTPIDVGYKISTGSGLTAHSIFVQGNFRW